MATMTPYLDAIQAIPGDTPREKFRWIANFIKQQLSAYKNLEDAIDLEKIPKPLVPLIQVQAAVMLNKRDPKNQITYEAIAEALKSEDKLVVSRALKAKNFFNGTNEAITSSKYFFENLFPFVSFNTRIRIIKTLASRLAPKRSTLAEKFFLSIESSYGIKQALPLLYACSESFAYNTIIEKRMVLSRKMVKLFFRKNPDFVVRYLRLSNPKVDLCARKLPSVNIHDFTDFLVALIKTRLDSFAEIYKMHEKDPPKIILSKNNVRAFLKNGREYLEQNTSLFINILPLKNISDNYIEAIFPKIFPDDIKDFNTDKMLNYLKYYRQDRIMKLFLRSYEQVYHTNILKDPDMITVNLLKILHPTERIRQAKIKLKLEAEAHKEREKVVPTWECFLSTEESLPLFEKEICITSDVEERARLVCKMIHCCKINKDYQALLRVLLHLKDKHCNERAWFLSEVFSTLLELYDLPYMGEDCWSILMDIMLHIDVKNDLSAMNSTGVRMIEAAIHCKILRRQPFHELINILVNLKTKNYGDYWNILQKYHKYERMCLEECLNIVSQKYNLDQAPWKEDRVEILFDLCSSIYYFNQVHVNDDTDVKPMAIKNYPWLQQAIEEILSTTKESDIYRIADLQNMCMKYEMDLYVRLWPRAKKIVEIKINGASRLLKRNPQDILDCWEAYLKSCKDNWNKRHAKQFIKSIRWYKGIPITFADQCLKDLTEKKEGACLGILSTLVYGESFSNIIQPLVPTNKTLDVHQTGAKINYNLVQHLVSGIKFANPPVPLEVLERLCQGDYLSMALTALTNVCKRKNVVDVISFATTLSNQRVAVRKHGIRLMCIVASYDQLLTFFQAQWKTEKNQSIREIMFSIVIKLFRIEPGPSTQLLSSRVISAIELQDENICPKILEVINLIPDQYVVDFIQQALNMIDKLENVGLRKEKIEKHTSIMLSHIDATICNHLPEYFIKDLIQRYLFHQNVAVSKNLSKFVVTALLLPAEDTFDDRLKMFSKLFKEAIVKRWNAPDSKHSHFFPVNNGLRNFIDVVTHATCISYSSNKLRLIDEILSVFMATLNPLLDPTSYLLLIFSKEQLSSSSPEHFGSNISRKLNDLVNIFSPDFGFFMVYVLRNMPLSNSFKHYNKIDVDLGIIEGLLDVTTNTSALMAMLLMHSINSNEQWERRDSLMAKITELQLPIIKAMASEIVNKRTPTG